MVEIRDTVRELIAMQMEESVTDEEIHKQQEKLNQVYDAYTAKYGVIGSNANKRAFSDDASYCLLQRYLSIISICRSQQLSLILLMADAGMIIPIGRMYLNTVKMAVFRQ